MAFEALHNLASNPNPNPPLPLFHFFLHFSHFSFLDLPQHCPEKILHKTFALVPSAWNVFSQLDTYITLPSPSSLCPNIIFLKRIH
jgi:hypothetical protein